MFAPPKELRRLIMSIVTDSRAPGEPKQVEGNALFQLYQAFAEPEQAEAMRRAFAEGIAWGEAKSALYGLVESQISPMREKYESLLAQPIEIEAVLREGAIKARKLARPFIAQLRDAVGLRDLRDGGRPVAVGANAGVAGAAARAAAGDALPTIKQYRENAAFHFKLLDGGGRVLLTSTPAGHAAARDAGQLLARLRASGGAGLRQASGTGVQLGGELVGELAADATLDELAAALARLAEADAAAQA
jgi:tryptophanyl-tRNA synthetase